MLWEERKRQRSDFISALNEVRASIDRAEGITITQESMRELAADVKRRRRERLAAAHPHSGHQCHSNDLTHSHASSIAAVDRSTTPGQKKNPWFMPSHRFISVGTPARRSRSA
jgi:hypothetical protein